MKTIYDVDYFIKKFESIPEWKWISGKFSKILGYGSFGFEQNCAQGFCMPKQERNKARKLGGEYIFKLRHDNFPEWHALVFLFDQEAHLSRYIKVAEINNGENELYQQSSPKKRVLAALYDIKLKQQQPKEKIVYVTVDQKVRELQAVELTEN